MTLGLAKLALLGFMKAFLFFVILSMGLLVKADEASTSVPSNTLEIHVNNHSKNTEAFGPGQVDSIVSDPYGIKLFLKNGTNLDLKPADMSSARALRIFLEAKHIDCPCEFAHRNSDFNAEFSSEKNDFKRDIKELRRELTHFQLSDDGKTELIVNPRSIHKWTISVQHKLD